MAEAIEDSVVCNELISCSTPDITPTTSRRRRNMSNDDSEIIIIETTDITKPKRRRRRRQSSVEAIDEEEQIVDLTSPVILTSRSSPLPTGSIVDLTVASPEKPDRNDNNDDKTCPVCMESLAKISARHVPIKATSCGHIFCSVCLDTVMRLNHICPICKKALRKAGNRTIYW